MIIAGSPPSSVAGKIIVRGWQIPELNGSLQVIRDNTIHTVTLHYITLHYSTLQYITVHYHTYHT